MSASTKRVARSQSKRKIAASTQPTIVDAFAKKRDLAKSQTADTREPPQLAEHVIEVAPPAPVAPVPVSEPEFGSEVVAEEELHPMTIKVGGTKRLDGSKPTKMFPLFNRSKPPTATQPPSDETGPTNPPSQPIDLLGSDETSLQAPEVLNPLPAKSRVQKWKSAPERTGQTAEDPIILGDSPTRTRSLLVEAKPSDSRAPIKLRKQAFRSRLGAPLPSGETQHVRGPQTVFSATGIDIPFKRRTRGPDPPASTTEHLTMSLDGIIHYPKDSPIPPDQPSTPLPPPVPPKIPNKYLSQHPVFQMFIKEPGPADAKEPGSAGVKEPGSADVKEPTADLWVNKWAPRSAIEVLGNEKSALYLKDWFMASKINSFSGSVDPSGTSTPASSSQQKKKPAAKRGKKRPRIRREVGDQKVKRRRRGCDWTADDDELLELESHPLDAYLDDNDFGDVQNLDDLPPDATVPLANLPPVLYSTPNILDMCNTIVLCGPSGSGKTAAVYACAKELNWEVCEVYPGVGKRSGTALDNLIGQVGRNHLVSKQRERILPPAQKEASLTRFYGVNTAQAPVEPAPLDGTSDGTDVPDIGKIEISEDGVEVPAPPLSDVPPPPQVVEPVQGSHTKQSLILLEEVDILYKDDVNFWPTVINIIRECRRPVVLTCNDASLLPIDQLPVQLTLYFTRPPAPVVTTYVSEICRAEGIQPDEHCFVDHLESVVDLRQCINQCQLGTSPLPPATVHLRETPRNHREDILEKYTSLPRWKLPRRDESQHKALWCLSKLTDTISYLDSRLVLRVDTDWSYPPSADDELGHTIVPTGDLTPLEFAYYYHDIELVGEVLSLTSRLSSRGSLSLDAPTTSLENPGRSGSETGSPLENLQLDSVASDHKLRMNQLATDLSVIPPFDQRLFLDYESVMREMVAADDGSEARIAASQEAEVSQYGRSRSQTKERQRLKAGFYRYLSLEPDRRDWLVRSTFGGRTI